MCHEGSYHKRLNFSQPPNSSCHHQPCTAMTSCSVAWTGLCHFLTHSRRMNTSHHCSTVNPSHHCRLCTTEKGSLSLSHTLTWTPLRKLPLSSTVTLTGALTRASTTTRDTICRVMSLWIYDLLGFGFCFVHFGFWVLFLCISGFWALGFVLCISRFWVLFCLVAVVAYGFYLMNIISICA